MDWYQDKEIERLKHKLERGFKIFRLQEIKILSLEDKIKKLRRRKLEKGQRDEEEKEKFGGMGRE